ncbi:MAG: response regulator transcription factor [Candidatus Brocadiia bacterium]
MSYVLIVDDDEEFAIAAAIVLRSEGHEVAMKTETSAAMTAMQVRRPDLVILDVMFPEDNFAGFELARAMCKSRDLSRVPILMLTGVNEKLGMRLDTLDTDNSYLPVSDFLQKPVNLDDLAGKAKSLLQAASQARS